MYGSSDSPFVKHVITNHKESRPCAILLFGNATICMYAFDLVLFDTIKITMHAFYILKCMCTQTGVAASVL